LAKQFFVNYEIDQWRPVVHCMMHNTGEDLSKILGGQPKILGEKVAKSDKCMGVCQLYRGHVPGLPSKSTPMMHKCIMAKLGGKRKTRKVRKKHVN